MRAAVDILAFSMLLIVGVWIAVFGTAGAAIRSRTGGSITAGACLGAIAGPLGLMWLWWRSARDSQERHGLG